MNASQTEPAARVVHDSVPGSTELDEEALKKASKAPSTQKAYRCCISGLSKWLHRTQGKKAGRLFDSSGGLNLSVFSPQCFVDFLVAHSADKATPLRPSTLSTYRSALTDLYCQRGLTPPARLKGMKRLFSGIKRKQAEKDLADGAPPTTVKQPLPFSTYADVCRSTLLRVDDGGFAHLFLITQWNMMCRSKEVADIHTSHLSANGDSIGCLLLKTKSHQDGNTGKEPRHLYANADSPTTCWITALAVYLACHPTQPPGKLFPGNAQHERFASIFKTQPALACGEATYGTHSIRKGVATYACSGSVCGPSMASVCRRCDWTLGNVIDRYIRYEAAGDQYLGRVVAGLPLDRSSFALLPPHFNDPHDAYAEDLVASTFPGLYQEKMHRPMLRLCLASLVYHAQFLAETLPPTHPLLSVVIFRLPVTLQKLRSLVNVRANAWMPRTGIPPFIAIYEKQDELQKAVETLPGVLTQVIEAKGVAAGNITAAVMQSMLTEALEPILEAAKSPQSAPPLASVEALSDVPRSEMYSWKNRLHPVPETFELTTTDPFIAWNLWWFGNATEKYPPYRLLGANDVPDSQKHTFSDWSLLMGHIVRASGFYKHKPPPTRMTQEESRAVFDAGFSKLPIIPLGNDRVRRTSQLAVTTMMRLVRKGMRQKANRTTCMSTSSPTAVPVPSTSTSFSQLGTITSSSSTSQLDTLSLSLQVDEPRPRDASHAGHRELLCRPSKRQKVVK